VARPGLLALPYRNLFDFISYNIGHNLKNFNEPGKVRSNAQNILKRPFGTLCTGGMVFMDSMGVLIEGRCQMTAGRGGVMVTQPGSAEGGELTIEY